MVHQVVDRYGQIDVLVNDAGIVPHFNWGIPRWPRVRFMSKDFWDNVIQTNLGGTFLCTKYIVPFMEARRAGNIVNLWGGGRAENHGAAAYVVSKDAIRTFTRFVAEEEREWNVCVVAFSPKQAIATEDAPEEARKRLPGPECLGNGFVLAAQAGMELTGKTVEHRDGNLVAVTKWRIWPYLCPLERVDSPTQGFTISFHFFQVVLRNVRLPSGDKETCDSFKG